MLKKMLLDGRMVKIKGTIITNRCLLLRSWLTKNMISVGIEFRLISLLTKNMITVKFSHSLKYDSNFYKVCLTTSNQIC